MADKTTDTVKVDTASAATTASSAPTAPTATQALTAAEANRAEEAAKTAEMANIPPATSFTPAGAPEQTVLIDVDHPAVDANPRANTSVNANRIDFNDPTLTGAEAVEKNLAAQKV